MSTSPSKVQNDCLTPSSFGSKILYDDFEFKFKSIYDFHAINFNLPNKTYLQLKEFFQLFHELTVVHLISVPLSVHLNIRPF